MFETLFKLPERINFIFRLRVCLFLYFIRCILCKVQSAVSAVVKKSRIAERDLIYPVFTRQFPGSAVA